MVSSYSSLLDPRQQEIDTHQTGVYCITDTRNGLRYVGSATISFHRRWIGHVADLKRLQHGNSRLQAVWSKYGQVFVFSILKVCDASQCIHWEQQFIDHFDSSSRACGYNLSPTAGSTRGMRCSDEHRAKISEGLRRAGRSITPEHLAYMHMRLREWNATHTRGPLTENHKAKISALHKGKAVSDESRQKMRDAKIGRKQTEEHKAKVSAALRRRRWSDTQREKFLRAMTGRQFTEEHRRNIGAARRGKPLKESTKAAIAASLKGRVF